MTVNVIPVADEHGAVTNADVLAASEGVHRRLRPLLPAGCAARTCEGLPITSFHSSRKP